MLDPVQHSSSSLERGPILNTSGYVAVIHALLHIKRHESTSSTPGLRLTEAEFDLLMSKLSADPYWTHESQQ